MFKMELAILGIDFKSRDPFHGNTRALAGHADNAAPRHLRDVVIGDVMREELGPFWEVCCGDKDVIDGSVDEDGISLVHRVFG